MTGRQLYVISVSAAAQMFDFLDFFLISFVIAFVAEPWHLTFGATTVILLSSGAGAVIGSFLCGALADRVGRLCLSQTYWLAADRESGDADP
jgi:putative MFS transporter